MNNRKDVIKNLLNKHPDAFFIFGNGLTSREASFFFPEDRCFYLLHGMGETLSIAIGLAKCRPNLTVIVVEGDGSAIMGLASWSLMPLDNIHYYILANGVHETTGGQKIPDFPFIPDWCSIIEMKLGQQGTPNPPKPREIMRRCNSWLSKNL